jgi:2'-5' RNA ligase
MKRIFIGLKVEQGEQLRDMISAVKKELESDKIKWTYPDNIHITLAFLGDTEEDKISPLGTMLKDQCGGSGKFELILKGAGVFRSMSDPRILWTGIEPSERLLQLNAAIIQGLKNLDIKIEERPFNPHLTIGRIKHINDQQAFRVLIEKYQDNILQVVPVNQVTLYESILLQAGPLYKPLALIDL